METQLQEAMASGVVVEVRDADGNSLAHCVYVDWRQRPVPAVGDTMCCEAVMLATGHQEKIRGRVQCRQFEVETDDAGQLSVWVRLVLEILTAPEPHPAAKTVRPYKLPFSAN